MHPAELISLISRWGGTMKFFPSGADERIGIADEIASFASNLDQVKWLVSRVPKLYREWPGLREVRAVFCSKFRPKDGFEVDSDVYLDGVPSERAAAGQLEAPDARYLPAPAEDPIAPAVAKRMEQLKAEMNRPKPNPKMNWRAAADHAAWLRTVQAEIEAIKAAQARSRTVTIPDEKETRQRAETGQGVNVSEVA